jgi:DNA-binding LytR/AlgR family response regulator
MGNTDSKIRTIIIDDEPMARTSLTRLCEQQDCLDIMTTLESASESIPYLTENQVDLIFLDIEMPGMTGLELLESLPYLPDVIFTTAHRDYAFEAFEYDVIDYLKKPVTQSRFLNAIKKVKLKRKQRDIAASTSARNEIYIKEDGRLIRLPLESILFFKNVGDYVRVITKEGKYIIHGSIKALNEKLNHPRFLKVHRSYIINLGHVKDIQDNSIVIDGNLIPVSRSHMSALMQSINVI